MNKAIKSASEAEAVICPNKSVMKLEPYKQGAAAAGGFENPIKLSSNESPFGPPPAALKAYHDAGSSLFRYPDGAQTSLRGAIAEVFGLNADRIVCGNGSEELQLLLVRSFLSPGDDVVMSEHSFVMGRIHAIAQGANIITAPEPEGRADAKSILAKLTPKTRMIMLASPNNPVGDYMRAEDFRFLVKNTPSDVVILYDGAYADYVTADDYDDGFSYVGWSPNVVVTRTFSKLYGLAGLRIGWLYAHDLVIDPVQRIRTPFNANVAALAAAEAAIRRKGRKAQCELACPHQGGTRRDRPWRFSVRCKLLSRSLRRKWPAHRGEGGGVPDGTGDYTPPGRCWRARRGASDYGRS